MTARVMLLLVAVSGFAVGFTPKLEAQGVSTFVRITHKTPLLAARSAGARRIRMLQADEMFRVREKIIARGGFIPLVVGADAGYVSEKDVTVEEQCDPCLVPVEAPMKAPDPPRIPEDSSMEATAADFSPIGSTPFLIFSKGPFYAMLTQDMVYPVGHTNDTIVVPAGFVTDFASIPRQLWNVLSPVGEYRLPAVVHDFLYWTHACNREQADNLLYIAMTEADVPSATRTAVWAGVRVGGAKAFTDNERQRTAKVLRIVPSAYRQPSGNYSWESYRAHLDSLGVDGDGAGISPPPHYCKWGEALNVP